MYDNDIVVIGDDQEEIMGLKSYLVEEFEIKDLVSIDISLELRWLDQSKDYRFLNRSTYKIYLRKWVCLGVNQLRHLLNKITD